MNNNDYNNDLIERIDNYLKFIEVYEKNDNKTIQENIKDHIEFQKYFLSSHKIERIIKKIYEETDKEDTPETDRLIIGYIQWLNKLSMQEKKPINQQIIMSMKSLILGSTMTDDIEKQKKMIKSARGLKRLLI